MTIFADFGLADPLLASVNAAGYTAPTPIQAQTIPHLLNQRDVLGIAQTGTGKTAAFALPALHHLLSTPKPRPQRGARVLILAPTRELAGQIATSFKTLSAASELSVLTVFGGVPVPRQIKQVKRGTDVLVATPGRLLDLVGQNALRLSDVEILVLDEADQMLDLGFIHALRKIVALVPRQRQTVLFSATMPKSIGELAQRYLSNPETVCVTPTSSAAERVDQRVIRVSAGDKPALLSQTLQDDAIERVLVFSRTKHGADRIVKRLKAEGREAAAIHGNKSQPQRERALNAFRTGALKILVATDIAARGIDIPGVSHVINFDLPNVAEQYVHRIGRTGRAGADGIAVSFVVDDERAQLRAIERLIKTTIPSSAFGAASGDRSTAGEEEREQRPAREPHHKRRRTKPNGGKPSSRSADGEKANRQAAKAGQSGDKPKRPRRRKPKRPAPPLEVA